MNVAQSRSGKRPGIWDSVRPIQRGLIGIGLVSGFLNLLLIGGALYVMVLLDTVVPAQSAATLVGLFVLAIAGTVAFGFFGIVRARLLADLATAIHTDISAQMPASIQRIATFGGGHGDGLQPLDDLEDLRSFLSSPVPGALLDLPWALLAVVFLFVSHVWLGVLSIVALLIAAAPCYLMERATARQGEWLLEGRSHRRLIAEEQRRHAETIESLGMIRRIAARWNWFDRQMLSRQQQQDQAATTYEIVSRSVRIVILAAVLTVGIALSFANEASTGVIVSCAILMFQVLAPADRAVAGWGRFAAARRAWDRLNQLLPTLDRPEVSTVLPPPVQVLEVGALSIAAPGTTVALVRNIGFRLNAGEALGIVGANGAGKTVLLRALAGYWRQTQGVIRLDGATLDQWDTEALAEHVGYLPQDVELMSGSVAQNIARFDPAATSDEVIAAAKAAGMHEFILRLPDGYETQVGRDGVLMPPGHRQRIGLARALFRNPFVLLLDDPDSKLDREGQIALMEAITAVRARKGIVIVVAYQLDVFDHVDHIMLMQAGTMGAFGPRDRMLDRLRGKDSRQVEALPEGGARH